MIERRSRKFSDLRREALMRRRMSGGFREGSGAGAPRSMQDQLEQQQASQRQSQRIVQAAIERVVAEQGDARTIPVDAETRDFDEVHRERLDTQNIDPSKMDRFLGGIATRATGDRDA